MINVSRLYRVDKAHRAVEAHDEHAVGIALDDLLGIPARLAVAGGAPKVEPILGALRGGLVNLLVTDSATATQVLELDAAG